jgi:hypothetical protein
LKKVKIAGIDENDVAEVLSIHAAAAGGVRMRRDENTGSRQFSSS